VWGIAVQEPADLVTRFRDAYDVGLPLLLDADGSVHALFEQAQPFPTGAFPQEWLIGKDGTIVWKSNRYEPDELKAAIDAALR
jgi:peroxiredoxin